MRRTLLTILTFLSFCLPAPARLAVHPHTTHHSAPHRAHKPSRTVKTPADQGVKVWVNTKTGVYHFPGQRWYGNTVEGEYLSESAAKKAGYRATDNGQ